MGFGWLAGAHASRRRTGVVLSVAIAMVLGLLSTQPTSADARSPDDDPFYAAPADLAAQPDGAVLGTRAIDVFGLPLPISAWQLRYRTTDSVDRPIVGVATVLAPTTSWDKGPRPLLSYQVPEDSLGTRCSPSFAFSGGRDPGVVNTLLDVPFMTAALLRGWGLVISDYEGPYSRFLDGPGAGRSVLDGVRAALSFAHGGVQATSPVGAWGYSGGAFATLWAAQMRATYAPQVRFAGISTGGVPADLPAIARRVDGGLQAGLALLIVMALTRNHPESGLSGMLNDRGRAFLAANATACGSDLVPQNVNAHVDDYTNDPNLLDSKVFRNVAAANELGVNAPDVPLYMYHSNSDDVIPVTGFSALVDRYCASGATVTAIHSPFPTHNGAAAGEALGGMNFLADRFAGRPVTPGCTIR
ncbi:lipase family protein [Nocardia sp. CA2R105]|uniref:lipase family protein n=1 Tax=Nocardia coffeae TaxID=2873381 RepID=UPI001CA752AA|nr:lipase family protein [Nocardia coffeae]MBY8857725.1 lipase family protein [Nocardia coffeae]